MKKWFESIFSQYKESSLVLKHFKVWNVKMGLAIIFPISITAAVVWRGKMIFESNISNSLPHPQHNLALETLYEDINSKGGFDRPVKIDTNCISHDRALRLKQVMTDLQKIRRLMMIERRYIDPDWIEKKIYNLKDLDPKEREEIIKSKKYLWDPDASNRI